MTPQEYIIQRLEGIKNFDGPPAKFKDEKELVDFIYKTVMLKKFRKYSVNREYQQHIRSAIELNVKNKEPIKFTLVFGGYKLWRLEESPEADWAELFALIYYSYWLRSIAQNYKPGVWFDFYSDDVIVELIDNIPKAETEKYLDTFRQLFDFIKSYLPDNFRFTLNRVGDQYASYEDFLKELNEKIRELEKQRKNEVLNEEQRTTVELNVRLKPGQDKDPRWREKVQLTHDAYMTIGKRRPYYRTPDKIIVITRPLNNSIAVGTTKTSVVKFWIGAGSLKKTGDSFMESILSPMQLKTVKCDCKDTLITGLEARNFKKIRIID